VGANTKSESKDFSQAGEEAFLEVGCDAFDVAEHQNAFQQVN
jgi:hypothetical protein